MWREGPPCRPEKPPPPNLSLTPRNAESGQTWASLPCPQPTLPS